MIGRFLRDERGATAIEYGLIMGLMFLVIVGAMFALGDATGALFERVATALRAAMGG
jgi:pilus assembly protein Flp/PilA